MRKVILATALTLSPLFANTIVVEVTDLLNQNGLLSIGLYNRDDDTFASMTQYYKGVDLKIDSHKATHTFTNIPDGTYAIAVIHDENENNLLDKNFLGIPKEGYGFSNNIRPAFRGANFEESKFELSEDKRLSIKLGY